MMEAVFKECFSELRARGAGSAAGTLGHES